MAVGGVVTQLNETSITGFFFGLDFRNDKLYTLQAIPSAVAGFHEYYIAEVSKTDASHISTYSRNWRHLNADGSYSLDNFVVYVDARRRSLNRQIGRFLARVSQNGSPSRIGNTNLTFFRLHPVSDGTTQYGITATDLYTINSNGVATKVGNLLRWGSATDGLFDDQNNRVAGATGNYISSLVGAAYDDVNDVIYASGYRAYYENGSLSRSVEIIAEVNKTTGAARQVFEFENAFSISDIAYDSANNTLYFISSFNTIYKIEPRPPTFTAPITQEVGSGASWSFNLTAAFRSGTAQTFAFQSGYTPPAYLTLTDGVLAISQAPTVQVDTVINILVQSTNDEGTTNGTIPLTILFPRPTPIFTAPTEAQTVQSGESWEFDLSTVFTRADTYSFRRDYTVPSYLRISGSRLLIANAPNVSMNTDITIEVEGVNAFGEVDGDIMLRITPRPPEFQEPPIQTARTGEAWTYDLTNAFTHAVSYAFPADYTVPPYLRLMNNSLVISAAPAVTEDTDVTIRINGINDAGTTEGMITLRITSTRRPIIGPTVAQDIFINTDYSYVIPITGDVTHVDVEGLWTTFSHTWDADAQTVTIYGRATSKVSDLTWTISATGPEGMDRRGVLYSFVDNVPVIYDIGTHTVVRGREVDIPLRVDRAESLSVVGHLIGLGFITATDIPVPGSTEFANGLRLKGEVSETDIFTATQAEFQVIANNTAGEVRKTGLIAYSEVAPLPLFTGEFARVGSAENFGVNQGLVAGLAYNPNLDVAYMVGSSGGFYTLDLTTGIATAVSTADFFGQTTQTYTGDIAFDPNTNTLYFVNSGGFRQAALWTMDVSNGTITRIGNVVNEGLVNGLAFDPNNNILYMGGIGNDRLYTVNVQTGVATPVDTTTVQWGIGETQIGALGYNANHNVLYGAGQRHKWLNEIDVTTGRATRIGNIVSGFGVGELFPSGLAYDTENDNLFMVGRTTDALYQALTN